MKLLLIGVGRIKKGYIREGVEDYLKRIKRYSSLEVLDIKEEKTVHGMPLSDVLKREANRVLAKVGKGDFVVALNDRGRSYTSKGLAELIERLLTGEKKRVCFIVGGAYGLHPSIIERADLTLSISPMTLPHEIARLVMVEQIYRAFTILKGEPYSH